MINLSKIRNRINKKLVDGLVTTEPVVQNPEFQSTVNTVAKDKFVMLLDLPLVLKEKEPLFNKEPLKFTLHGLSVPEISVTEVSARYQGQNMFVSSYTRPNYSPLTINFVVDNTYSNYYTLWRWLDVLNLSEENKYGGTNALDTSTVERDLQLGDQTEYQTTAKVVALNEYEQPLIEFNYTKLFITKLGGISYSYRDAALLESSAEFHFSQLFVEKSI